MKLKLKLKQKKFNNNTFHFAVIGVIIVLFIFLSICMYAYFSGSCIRNHKNYKCNSTFCLHKEFSIVLPNYIMRKLHDLIKNKQIQKRVNIEMKPEMMFGCALPNKKGITIPTKQIKTHAPQVIEYYQTTLKNSVSNLLNFPVEITDLSLPTSCAILIYEDEGDWINWHYDYNYYDGRFFTLLIPITNTETCTMFEYKDPQDNNKVKSVNLINNLSILFEGNYLYHRATKLCDKQRRAILSCQFVSNNNMSFINKLRLRLKDFAYIGGLGFV